MAIKLKTGTLYFADNGRVICRKCAGQSALYTGRDISGQKVEQIPRSFASEWKNSTGETLACESGCTSY